MARGTPAITMHANSVIDTSGAGKDITLTNSSGGIQLATLTTGTTSGTVSLAAGGAVTQAGSITAPNLSLTSTGAGSFDLADPGNKVSSLSANLSGPLTYVNSGSLAVAAAAESREPAGAISLKLRRAPISAERFDAGTGDLTLTATTSVNQTADITGAGLELLGSGTFMLARSGNSFSTIAANTTGKIDYQNSGGLTVGTVNFAGIKSGNGDVLISTTGDLSVANNINAGSGNVLLDAGGTVSGNHRTRHGQRLGRRLRQHANFEHGEQHHESRGPNHQSRPEFQLYERCSFYGQQRCRNQFHQHEQWSRNSARQIAVDLSIDAPVTAGNATVELTSLLGAVNESGAGVSAGALLVQATSASMLTGGNNVAKTSRRIRSVRTGAAFGLAITPR